MLELGLILSLMRIVFLQKSRNIYGLLSMLPLTSVLNLSDKTARNLSRQPIYNRLPQSPTILRDSVNLIKDGRELKTTKLVLLIVSSHGHMHGVLEDLLLNLVKIDLIQLLEINSKQLDSHNHSQFSITGTI